MPINDPSLSRKRTIRLLVLATIVILIGGGIFTLFQINRTDQIVVTDEELIAQAQSAYEEGDYELVLELLENPRNNDMTLAAIDGDPELLRIYVTARQDIPMFNDRHLTRTVEPLKKLIAFDSSDRKNQDELLDALLQLERYDEAIVQAKMLAELHPKDASVLRKLAKAQRQKKQREAALATLYRAAELEPLHVLTYAEVLDILQEYGDPIEPLIEMTAPVYAAYPDDPRAMMIQAISDDAQGNGVQARDLLKRASTKAPGDQEIVPLLVRWLDRLGLFTTATAYLEEYAEPGIDSMSGRLAIYRAFEAADYASVLARMQDSDTSKANSDLVAMLASALLNTGDTEGFEQKIKNLEQRDSVVAKTWAKLLKLDQQGDASPATLIDTIVATMESEENEVASALAKQHPYFTQRLGQAYVDALENEAAYGAFIVAAKSSRTWARPHRSLAETLLKLNQPAAAFFHAREAQRREDTAESRQWLVLAMVAVADTSDNEVIERTLSEVELLDVNSPQATRVLPAAIDLLVRAGRIEQAKQRITDTLALEGPRSVQLLESLAQLSQQHKLEMTNAIAQTLEKQHGMTRGLALIQASDEARNKGFEAGLALITKAAPDP
ncbi:MAG: tetratricopeptide repeat protein, partial [Phycisphaeraceae bacterium]